MRLLDRLPYQEDLRVLWSIFPQARLVGGVVRDLLLDRPSADIDLATPEIPDVIFRKLRDANIKAIPTGIAHGTVTAIVNHHAYEITTLRKDIRTDGRHAEVVWTDSWQEDAARRDFTVNALYCDQHGKLWDYFTGQEDLAQGRLRFVGDAYQRISEDFLRILRFFRFYARYGKGQPDQEALLAIQHYAASLDRLSAERIWMEFQKILCGPKADAMLLMMDATGVLKKILPYGYDLVFFRNLIHENPPLDEILRLAGVVKGNLALLAKHLKFSRKQEKKLSSLLTPLSLSFTDSDMELRRLKASFSLEILIGKSWIEQALGKGIDASEWQSWRERVVSIPQPVFPLTGKDLLEVDIDTGPEMGRLLKAIQAWWLQDGCQADRETCLKQIGRAHV